MPSLPIPEPGNDNLIEWCLDNPRAVRDAFRLLNIIAKMQFNVVTPSAVLTLGDGKPVLQISDVNAVAPLPLKLPFPYGQPIGAFSRGIMDASETTSPSATYVQAQAAQVATRLTETRQLLAALITDLQTTGQVGKL